MDFYTVLAADYLASALGAAAVLGVLVGGALGALFRFVEM